MTQLHDAPPDVRSTRSQIDRITTSMDGRKEPINKQGSVPRFTQRDLFTLLAAIAFTGGAAALLRNADTSRRIGGVNGLAVAHTQIRAELRLARDELDRLHALGSRDRARP